MGTGTRTGLGLTGATGAGNRIIVEEWTGLLDTGTGQGIGVTANDDDEGLWPPSGVLKGTRRLDWTSSRNELASEDKDMMGSEGRCDKDPTQGCDRTGGASAD